MTFAKTLSGAVLTNMVWLKSVMIPGTNLQASKFVNFLDQSCQGQTSWSRRVSKFIHNKKNIIHIVNIHSPEKKAYDINTSNYDAEEISEFKMRLVKIVQIGYRGIETSKMPCFCT